MLLVVFGVLFAMAGANLSPEERDRLIYKNDESVIMEKIKEMPEVVMNPPEYLDLPVPTMDPNLPLIMTRNNNKIRPNRFGDIMKNTLRMLRGNKNGSGNSPRNGRLLPGQRPEQRRPSSLTTSTADEIEMAFKRMEIMASRAGLNMSALPRRTQMQVIKRLKSFLPPRLGTMVAETMENEPKKMFSYLPEPARDPLIEDDPNYLTKFLAHDLADQTNNNAAELHAFSPGKNDFESFASTSSLFASPSGPSPSDVSFSHLPAITEAYEGRDEPSPSLIPPHFDGIEFSRQVSPPTLNLDTYNEPDSSQQQSHIHHLNTRDRHHSNPEAAPLISESHSVFSGSENIPVIISPNSKINPGRFEKALKNLSMITPTPILRVSSPTKEKIIIASSPAVSSTVKPIRVSIISKDSLSSGDPMVKVINIDPIVSTSQSVTMVRGNSDEEIPISNSNSPNPPKITTTTMSPGLQVKEMIDSVIEAEKDKHERQREREIAQVKEALKPITNPMNDFYDYTESEEMRALEELKKYEDLYDNSLELLQPHPLEYPDHPEHPKDESQPGPSPSPSAKPAMGMRPNRLRVPPQQHRPGRPRPPFHPNQFKQRPQQRPRPRPRPNPNKRPPLRINDVTISTMPQHFDKECDFFSDEICLLVQDYPIEAISEALDQNPVLKQMLIKEPAHISYVEGVPKAQESNYNYGHYFDRSHKHRDFAGEGGFLCPSKVAYGKIKKAKSASSGAWKFVVNYAENTQTLRLEKCLAPGNTCSYVMPHYRTACTQVYNYHRLLAWDSEKGLHMDVFKVPTCCTCHVQGYYIPGQSPRPAQLKFNSPPPPKKIIMEQPKDEPLPTPLPLVRNSNNADRELQDLLQQYSSLREIIAKRRQAKNGSGKINFPVNKEGVKSRRQSRRSNFPLERKNLKVMRERRLMARLTRQLRVRDNRQKLKILKEKLKLKTLGKGKGRRKQRQMSLGSYRKRELLNKYERIRGIRKRQKEHRLSYRRLPPKVNYSYHPIMDYFGRRRSLMKRKT